MDEAEKLRAMNESQKAEYEQENKEHTLLNWKLKSIVADQSEKPQKMLSEGGIVADDKILSIVVKDTAESTQEAVESFVALVNELADKKVGEKLKVKRLRKWKTLPQAKLPRNNSTKWGIKVEMNYCKITPSYIVN